MNPSGEPNIRRILVIYTGGTIGMVRSPHGYRPERGVLEARLRQLPQLHVHGEERLTLPDATAGATVVYDVVEDHEPKDSANMATADWVRIARQIEASYEDYDAFVVLHGTDTMAYTASALSFMMVNLRKPVILTGSQIPLTRVRNDAVDNMLGALTIAARFDLPEVGLYFRNRLLRGNRARKVDAAGFEAFDSGNCRPLAKVGVAIDVAWDVVRRPSVDGAFAVHPITNREVASLRLFPGMTADVLRRVVRAPLAGLVLETYGSGNAPNDDRALLSVLKEATERGLVVVNVTQCVRGRVTPAYAANRALSAAGVVSGHDMTAEAALTKLAYLLSRNLETEDVRRLMSADIRGELTVARATTRTAFQERAFVHKVSSVLAKDGFGPVGDALYPVLLCAAARNDDTESIVRILAAGVDVSAPDHDGRTALHLAAAEGHQRLARWLVNQGARTDSRDRWGRSPADEAAHAGHNELAAYLVAAASG